MSYYYQYYIGVQDKHSGIIKPFAPYDANGNLHAIIERSRSFASNLYQDFYAVPEDKISEELRKEFEYEDYTGTKKVDVKYLPYEELGNSDYIVKGYFPIEDVQAWEQGGDDTVFYNVIDAHRYAELLKKELMFGKNKTEKDEDGYEYTPLNASDYIYDAIPNYNSKEYEIAMIKQFVDSCIDYDISKDYNIVILETEG